MSIASVRQFNIFFDPYYWKTAVLIARNGLARQYRNSFLGMMWTLLQPLVMVGVYALIMPLIMRSSMPNYPLYIIVSLPVWSFFSGVLITASQSILANGEVLKRCMVSSTVFPIADVLRSTYTFCVSFLTMYTVALLTLTSFNPVILLLPLYFIPVLMIIGAGAIAIAFMAPYVRDIGEVITIAMNMLFWMTPIVYSVSVLPERIQMLMQFNPFFIMMHPIQVLAYAHEIPSMGDTLRLLALTAIAIIIGFSIFRVCRRNYVYYL
jgi:lipopolysaccharide transport system permease protein